MLLCHITKPLVTVKSSCLWTEKYTFGGACATTLAWLRYLAGYAHLVHGWITDCQALPYFYRGSDLLREHFRQLKACLRQNVCKTNQSRTFKVRLVS